MVKGTCAATTAEVETTKRPTHWNAVMTSGFYPLFMTGRAAELPEASAERSRIAAVAGMFDQDRQAAVPLPITWACSRGDLLMP